MSVQDLNRVLTAKGYAIKKSFLSDIQIQGLRSELTVAPKVLDRFQKDKSCNFFFGTIGAAGVGITLTAADIALFIERAWSPSDNIQAEDRIHRLSQNSDNVQIVKLICEGTIDEHVENLLDKKET